MSTSIVIEKNIPHPAKRSLPEMPLDQMVAGDSFFVPVSHQKKDDMMAIRQRVVRYQRKNPDTKFSVHRETNYGTDGLRVYRITTE